MQFVLEAQIAKKDLAPNLSYFLPCPKILRKSPKILPLTSVSSFSPPSVLCWPIMTSPNLMFLIRDQHLHIKLIPFYPVLVIVGAFDVPPTIIKRLIPPLFRYVNNTRVSTDNLFVAILMCQYCQIY